jgi:hypothetical protein
MNHNNKISNKNINYKIIYTKEISHQIISKLNISQLYQNVIISIILDNIKGKLSSRLNDKHIFS